MLLLSMVCYQVLLCLDTYDTDATAIHKLCKLKFQVFYHVLSYKLAAELLGFFNYGVYFFETLVIDF